MYQMRHLSVRSFKQQLRAIEKKYQQPAPVTIPPVQAALEQHFLAARHGQEDPPTAHADCNGDGCNLHCARRKPRFPGIPAGHLPAGLIARVCVVDRGSHEWWWIARVAHS